MRAASRSDPLLADWVPHIASGEREWSMVAAVAGDRAQALVDDFPVAAAMIRARIMATIGADGLRFCSLYSADSAPDTTSVEERIRHDIDAAISGAGPYIDVEGIISRRDLEAALAESAIIRGDGIAVRVGATDPASPLAHAWRIVDPRRVCNPRLDREQVARAGLIELSGGRTVQDGIECDRAGRRVAIHILVDRRTPAGVVVPAETQRIPWYSEDGATNVIHVLGLRRQGSRRGISEFAPVILDARLLQSLGVAYVATKRVQASHPMLISVDDIEAAQRAYAGTAFANLLIGRDHNVQMNNAKFEGSDYREFYDAALRNLTAAWAMPYELVVGDHSAKSGASARSLWQQFYLSASCWQTRHIDSVTSVIDREILRDRIASGALRVPLDRAIVGRYKRPPRVMPDPLKEAQAAEMWAKLGVSETTLFADAGMDYTDEIRQKHQDRALARAQGFGDRPAAAEVRAADADFVGRVAAIRDAIAGAGLSGELPWQIVIAAGAATEAPGAFLEATLGRGAEVAGGAVNVKDSEGSASSQVPDGAVQAAVVSSAISAALPASSAPAPAPTFRGLDDSTIRVAATLSGSDRSIVSLDGG